MKKKRKKSNKSASFLRSYEWKKLRVDALNRDGCRCILCGSTEGLSVHHIADRRGWPEHALDIDNCVTLCCRHHAFGKESAHRGVGYWLLCEWLRKNRPEQYMHVMEILMPDAE